MLFLVADKALLIAARDKALQEIKQTSSSSGSASVTTQSKVGNKHGIVHLLVPLSLSLHQSQQPEVHQGWQQQWWCSALLVESSTATGAGHAMVTAMGKASMG